MNYYEHHLGDYAEATSHLSFVEDAAYSRMLRKAYATEKPLPADIRAVQRLIGARTKEEREAVEVVLAEFWQLAEDGWHNKRCDVEIGRYRDGEPERTAKKANENLRLKRHREERAALFQIITAAGQHAAWNLGMNELRELAKRCGSPLPATAPATPATATQTPVTSTEQDSEAIASDGEPPAAKEAPKPKPKTRSPDEMAKADLWKAAVAVLAAGGCENEAMARSFMGKLVGDYTQATVTQAIAAAVTAQPADAREYLKATCQRLKGERKDPLTVPSDDAAKTAAYLAERAAQPKTKPPAEVLALVGKMRTA